MSKQEFYERLIQTAETAAAVVDSQGEYGDVGREAYLDHGIIIKVDDDATNHIRISIFDDNGIVFDAVVYFHVLSVRVFRQRRWQDVLNETLDTFPPCQFLTIGMPSELTHVEILFDEGGHNGSE